jgi:hypothetical protein
MLGDLHPVENYFVYYHRDVERHPKKKLVRCKLNLIRNPVLADKYFYRSSFQEREKRGNSGF